MPPARPPRPLAAPAGAAAAAALLLAAGCGRAPAPRGLVVCSWNLDAETLLDRDGDGQANDPKPAAARDAAADLLARVNPDVLAVQELGPSPLSGEFAARLARRGLGYPHVATLPRAGPEGGLAVLSRRPFSLVRAHTNDTYAIGESTFAVQRGFLEVAVPLGGARELHLFVAHLKSKEAAAPGQNEMRRNEARLLGQHVRRRLREDPAARVLVVGTLNDRPESAPLREVCGDGGEWLRDLRPVDDTGAAWTAFDAGADACERLDYALASRGARAVLGAVPPRIEREPRMAEASRHRPLVLEFAPGLPLPAPPGDRR